MNKQAGHVEDRAQERTSLSPEEIQAARAYVKKNRKRFLKGKTYSIAAPGRKGYYIVGDVGEGRKKHVIKTVYGVNMKPPGTVIQNALIERELIKAAEALFTLEKTASVVAVSLAELNFEKAASAYLGYTWEDWQTEDSHTKEALIGKIKTMFSGARGFVNRKGADVLSRVGVSNKALAGSRQQAAKSYGQYAKGLEGQGKQMSNLQHGKSWGSARAGAKQTQAAKASARAAQQNRMAAQGMTGPMADSQLAMAKTQQGHMTRQLNAAKQETNLMGNMKNTRQQMRAQKKNVSQAEQQLANANTGSAQRSAQQNLKTQQQQLQQTQQESQRLRQQVQQRKEIREMGASGGPAPQKTTNTTTNTQKPTTDTKAPSGKDTAKPDANSSKAAPTEESAPGMSMKQLGYGALGGTALAGGGYMGYKALTAPPPEQLPGQQKLANWYDVRSHASSASEALDLYKQASVEYRGRTFPGYNQPIASDKEGKKKMVLAKKGGKVKLVHFGADGYKHNYSKAAKKNYLTRSAGIRNKSGELTMNDKHSPNYWARKHLWPKRQKADGSELKKRK